MAQAETPEGLWPWLRDVLPWDRPDSSRKGLCRTTKGRLGLRPTNCRGRRPSDPAPPPRAVGLVLKSQSPPALRAGQMPGRHAVQTAASERSLRDCVSISPGDEDALTGPQGRGAAASRLWTLTLPRSWAHGVRKSVCGSRCPTGAGVLSPHLLGRRCPPRSCARARTGSGGDRSLLNSLW